MFVSHVQVFLCRMPVGLSVSFQKKGIIMIKQLLKAGSLLAFAAAPFVASEAFAQGDGYVGVSVGYGWTKADVNTSTVFSSTGYFASSSVPAINAAGQQQVKPKGLLAGIDAGYDFHSGNLVFGLAADLSRLHDSKAAATTVTYPCCSPTSFTVTQGVSTRWMATVRARVGMDVGGGSVVYVTGGYAGIKARYSSLFTDTFASAFEAGTSSKWRSGWVVGGGADIKVAPQWSIQPEFLHADFGHFGAPASVLTTTPGTTTWPTSVFTHRASLKANIARVGFHYHF
jgi:outer membrane immunogenic protein